MFSEKHSIPVQKSSGKLYLHIYSNKQLRNLREQATHIVIIEILPSLSLKFSFRCEDLLCDQTEELRQCQLSRKT